MLLVAVCVRVFHLARRPFLTSLCVVKVDKPLPVVVFQETENSSSQAGPHLDDKLHISVSGEAGRDEGGVQCPTERGQRVHGLLVVEAEDGINSSGELGANCQQKQSRAGSGQGQTQQRTVIWGQFLFQSTNNPIAQAHSLRGLSNKLLVRKIQNIWNTSITVTNNGQFMGKVLLCKVET